MMWICELVLSAQVNNQMAELTAEMLKTRSVRDHKNQSIFHHLVRKFLCLIGRSEVLMNPLIFSCN